MPISAALITSLISTGGALGSSAISKKQEKKLSQLNAIEQEQLAKELQAAKTEADKRKLLEEAYHKAQMRQVIPIIAGVGLLVFGVIIFSTALKK